MLGLTRSSGAAQAAGDGAEEDGEEGPGLDERVAAHQILAAEQVRQDAVFDRAEERRLHAQEQQHRELEDDESRAAQREAQRRQHHHAHFPKLDPANERRFLELVGELTRRRREREVGEDEDRGGDGDDDLGRRRIGEGLVGDERDQRRLQEIVVHRAQELRDEERQEAALAQ